MFWHVFVNLSHFLSSHSFLKEEKLAYFNITCVQAVKVYYNIKEHYNCNLYECYNCNF